MKAYVLMAESLIYMSHFHTCLRLRQDASEIQHPPRRQPAVSEYGVWPDYAEPEEGPSLAALRARGPLASPAESAINGIGPQLAL